MSEIVRKPGVKKGQNLGGVRTIEDLRLRSVIDHDTGCWNVKGYQTGRTVQVWYPVIGKVVSLAVLIAHLKTGTKAPKGKTWHPICGNPTCGNPDHRKLMTHSSVLKAAHRDRPRDPQFRLRLADSMRKRAGSRYCPTARAEILASQDSNAALGKKFGMTPQSISKIRAGRMWRDAVPASSIFNLAGVSR